LDKKDIRNEAWLTTLENGWAARLGNEKVFKWALRNNFYKYETGKQLDQGSRELTHKNTGISR
jgi:hypothetical protein